MTRLTRVARICGAHHIYRMPKKTPKRPKDTNQLAKSIVDIATEADEAATPAQASDARDPHAVILGRRGGLKGGKARAEALTSVERQSIASKAARVRWARKTKSD